MDNDTKGQDKAKPGTPAAPAEKPVAPKKQRPMLVQAIDKGLYGGARCSPEVRSKFYLRDPKHFSPRWMKILEATPEQIAQIPKDRQPTEFKAKKRVTFVDAHGKRIRAGAALPSGPSPFPGEEDVEPNSGT